MKKISVTAAVLITLASCVVTFCFTYVLSLSVGKTADTQSGTSPVSDSYDKLEYVDSIFRQYYIGELDEDQISDYLIHGYVAGTGDRYASYMNKEQFSAYSTEVEGEFVGVGIHVTYTSQDGSDVVTVISVMPDSPALEAGVQANDIIESVGGVPVSELGYAETVNRMLGEEGTPVTFTVYRKTQDGNYREIEFTMNRRKVDDATVEYRMYDDEIGIVRITSFSEKTDESVIRAVENLRGKGAKKLIFDVRYNPGGELSGIVDTLDYLLPAGPIVHITDKNGNVKQTYESDADCVDLPMCVLCNGSTCSAAELFTSAMKDYEAATIVGTTTYGKGTVLNTFPLPDGSGISLSTMLYNPPFSENFEGVGVEPDEVVEMSDETKDMNVYLIPDEMDDQLQAALRILNEK